MPDSTCYNGQLESARTSAASQPAVGLGSPGLLHQLIPCSRSRDNPSSPESKRAAFSPGRLKCKTLLGRSLRSQRDLHRGSKDHRQCRLLLHTKHRKPQSQAANRVAVTSMLVAFSFSSITCFRMTREDLIASFSVIDCKRNPSLIALWTVKQVLARYPFDCGSVAALPPALLKSFKLSLAANLKAYQVIYGINTRSKRTVQAGQ